MPISPIYYELVMPIVVLLILMVFILIMRYFSFRERITLIKQGFVPPDLFNAPKSKVAVGLMRAGLITTMVSLFLLIGLWVGLGQGAWLIGGFIPVGVGIGLIFSSWFSHHSEPQSGIDQPAQVKNEQELDEETVH